MKIDTTEPPALDPESVAAAINYTADLKGFVCFSDARPPDEVAPALGVSPRTLVRWREKHNCPCYPKTTESGQEAYHYCGQEVLFWIIRRHYVEHDGPPLPDAIAALLDHWLDWQRAYVDAGRLRELLPPEKYEDSGTHYGYMLHAFYEVPGLIGRAEDADTCPLIIDTNRIESRAYRRYVVNRLQAAIDAAR